MVNQSKIRKKLIFLIFSIDNTKKSYYNDLVRLSYDLENKKEMKKGRSEKHAMDFGSNANQQRTYSNRVSTRI